MPSPYRELKERAWAANREIPKRGLAIYTFGNVSALDVDRGVMAIKPSGVAYDELTVDDMVVVDLSGKIVEGKLRPSSDTPTHLVLYRAWQGIGGVVHTHSRYATGWAQARLPIPIFGTTHADHLAEGVPCTAVMSDEAVERDYEVETGNQILECFAKRDPRHTPMVLVAGHGAFTWGETPEKAIYNAAVLEELARMAFVTHTLQPAAARLPDRLIRKHFERKHGKNAYYGQTQWTESGDAGRGDGHDRGDEEPVNPHQDKAKELILSGAAVLGIELGSTRIKASLIAPDTTPLASGSHTWENQLEDGIWTYHMEDVWKGLSACYAALVQDVRTRYRVELGTVAALGFSGMMHGYVALDRDGKLLVPFRTWRNTITGQACAELSPLLDFAVPQRWSIAHLYQSILEEQPHVSRIAHLTTLAGYVHWKLTGEHKVGVGEASGMFPIDPLTGDWDAPRMAVLDALVAPRKLGWKLRDILPDILTAGCAAGQLTAEGAKLLDPTGRLPPGIPLCPPEGDAGTGMVATNAVRPRSGNVSAGTSVFAMIVLEKSLSRVHEEIDIVVTPDGRPVAMVHSNNGSSDLDAWMALFGQVARALGVEMAVEELYSRLLPLAIEGDPDAGGLLSINYVSGEHLTGFTEGRPLFTRSQDGKFTLANFVRAMYHASLCAMRTGMNILTEEEGVVIDDIRGHGGFFKGGDTGQRMMAAALNVPVSISATAGEGGAWGMAVLAAYMLRSDAKQSLPDYLDARIAGSLGKPVHPDPRDVKGFAEFFARHKQGLAIEREAVKSLQ